jgi:chitodextrinase
MHQFFAQNRFARLIMMIVMISMVISPFMSLTASANTTGLTIHFKKPTSWGTPQLYYYDQVPAAPTVPDTTWASAPDMTAETGGWFVYTIAGATSATVIFKDSNNNQIPAAGQGGFTRTQEGWFDGTTWYLSNPDAPDTESPTVPANLVASVIGSTSVTLSWTAATDNKAVTGYEVWQNGVKLADATGTTYTATGLTPLTAYTFKVRAKDAAGNFSLATSDLTVTTKKSSYTHTLTNNGTNDFYNNTDPAKNETFSTSSADHFSYVTWDDNKIYIGYASNNMHWNTSDGTQKWLTFYVGVPGVSGTSVTQKYNSQQANLPFEAKYLIRFRPSDSDNGVSSIQTWNNGWSTTKSFVWNTEMHRDTDASPTFVKLVLNRSDLGLTSANSFRMAGFILKEVSNEEWMWGAFPSDSFTDGYDKNVSTFYEFDLTANVASASQVYNYQFKNSAVTPSTATFTFSASTNATNVAIHQSTDGGSTWTPSTLASAISSASTTATVNGLTPDQNYKFRLVVEGGTNAGSSSLVNVKTEADTVAPTAPTNLQSANLTSNSVDLSWTASTDAGSGIKEYLVYQGTTLLGKSSTTNYAVTGLTASTNYSFTVKAVDLAGNESAASTATSITTSAPPDTQAPTTPTNLAAATVTDTSVTLTWSASTDNVAVTGYEVWVNGSKTADVTTTTYTATGLTPLTTNTFKVRAKDAAGNFSTATADLEVTTQASTPADNENPTAPTDLASSNVTQTNVTLTWTASTDNVGVTGYEVWQDGTKIADATTTSYTVTGLTAANTYKFKVRAKDAAGNFSVATDEISVTTQSPPTSDTQVPTVPTDLASSATTQTAVTLTWTASTDNVGVTGYEVWRDGTKIADVISTSYTLTGMTAATTYKFKVRATDAYW